MIITNQSGITKKYLSWSDYAEVTNQLISLLEKPNPVTAIYANSYVTDKPSSNWRKPNPSMILSAAEPFKFRFKKVNFNRRQIIRYLCWCKCRNTKYIPCQNWSWCKRKVSN